MHKYASYTFSFILGFFTFFDEEGSRCLPFLIFIYSVLNKKALDPVISDRVKSIFLKIFCKLYIFEIR